MTQSDDADRHITALGLGTENARTIAIANVGVLITVLPFALIALRIVAVAKGDSATLAALTSTLSVQAAFFHAVVALVPLYVVTLVMWILFRLHKRRAGPRGDWDRMETMTVSMGAVLLWGLVPLDLLLVATGLTIGYGIFRRCTWEWVRGIVRGVGGVVVGILLLGPFISLTSGESMWLPAEKISVRGEEQSVI